MMRNEFAVTYLDIGKIADLPDNHFIDGTWLRGASGHKMLSYDPALA